MCILAIPWEGKAKWELLNSFYLGFYEDASVSLVFVVVAEYLKLLNREKLLRCLYRTLLSLTSVDIPEWVSWGRGYVCHMHRSWAWSTWCPAYPTAPVGVSWEVLLVLLEKHSFWFNWVVFLLHSVMWLTLVPDACKLNLCMCCCNLAFKTHLVCAYTHAGGYGLVYHH